MDQFLLQAVASEAAARLVEQEVLRVSHLGRLRYLLRFATSSKDNLLLSIRPDLPRVHLVATRRLAEEPPDRFATLLDHEIGGAVLASLEKSPWDRVLEMRFRLPRRQDGAAGRRLVIELLGRSSNLLLLDERGTLLGACRDLRSEFRAPVAGEPYRPPPARGPYGDIPPDPEALPLIRERFGSTEVFLGTVSPLMARDLAASAEAGGEGAERRTAAGEPEAERRLRSILEAASSGAWSPVVYSRKPLEEMVEGDRLGADDLVVAPLPLLAPPSPSIAVRFDSPSAAAEAAFDRLERLRDFSDACDHHRALVRKEVERLEALARKLEKELRQAEDSDRLRIMAEALLAGLSSARLEGRAARVADPYDPDGRPLEVSVDPSLSLQENAQVLFGRYKKGKRALAAIGRRRAAVSDRLEEWRALGRRLVELRGPDDLERLREAMSRLGLVHSERPARSASRRLAGETPARVRHYTSPDGLVILVGKSGEENDTLTFRVASPWDFWLHVAERPGAHVVVRNPQRLRSLPEATLRLAAEIAAFHSGARRDSKVEVHFTQRKHVHKKKGMPRGQVVLRRFRTIQVAPGLPVSSIGEV